MSKLVHKCPFCRKRIRRPPSVSLKDRRSRRESCYHGAPHLACLEAAAAEAERRGPDEIILAFYHSRACGDPAGKMACRGGCFAVNESTAEEGAA